VARQQPAPNLRGISEPRIVGGRNRALTLTTSMPPIRHPDRVGTVVVGARGLLDLRAPSEPWYPSVVAGGVQAAILIQPASVGPTLLGRGVGVAVQDFGERSNQQNCVGDARSEIDLSLTRRARTELRYALGAAIGRASPSFRRAAQSSIVIAVR
jgi:hypothetical protein